jgi:hypothetical protein
MKYIIIYVIFFIPVGVLSQTEKDIEPRNENYISTDLLSPFYGIPRYRINYIQNINNKNKIGLEFGYGNEDLSIFYSERDYKLWEIRSEYYRIINPKRKTLKYFTIELFYINQSNEFVNQTFRSEQSQYLRFDKADYKRQKLGLVPKFGMFVNLTERIGINWYTGIGFKFRMNRYSNFVNLEINDSFQEHFPPYYRNEGDIPGIEFTVGLKLYYRIKPKTYLKNKKFN